MTAAALYGKQDGARAGVPNLPLGCCSSERSHRRHIIETEWQLPSLPPSAVPNLSFRELELKASQKALLESVLCTLQEEFQRWHDTQAQADTKVQEQMLSMDGKLNRLLQGYTVGNGTKIASEGDDLALKGNGTRRVSEGEDVVRNTLVQASSPKVSLVPRAFLTEVPSGDEREDKQCIGQLRVDGSETGIAKARATRIEAVTKRATRIKEVRIQSQLLKDSEDETLIHPEIRLTAAQPAGLKCVAKVVMNPWFDAVVSIFVVLNSILLGLQVNQDASSDETIEIFDYFECFFAGVFTLELMLRIIAAGTAFCRMSEPKYFWPIFDSVLVILSWIDIVIAILGAERGLPGPAATVGRMLRMARMARIIRVLRMTKVLAKVRVMGVIIIGSISSLFWLFLLLVTIMFQFAVWLTQGAAEWLRPMDRLPPIDDESYELIKDTFGSVPRSMQTLFESVTGGRNWGNANELAEKLGAIHAFVFSFFVFFFFFSVLNIVTGVYVDGAIQQAHNDRAMLEMQKDMEKEHGVQLLGDTLAQIDVDESGCITREEWNQAMHDESVRNLMELLEVDVSDAEKLFDLLNSDGDETLNISEFVEGMHRLKGHARSIDVHLIVCRLNYLIVQIRHLFKDPKSEMCDIITGVG